MQNNSLGTHCDIALWWMPQNERINIVSGNGFVTSGNKPLPDPKLTPIYVAIWP